MGLCFDVDARVRAGAVVAQVHERRVNNLVPHRARLPQAVERAVELHDLALVLVVFPAGRHAHVDWAVQVAVQVSGVHVGLVDVPPLACGVTEQDANAGEGGGGRKGGVKVHTLFLKKALCDQSSFELLGVLELVKLEAKNC